MSSALTGIADTSSAIMSIIDSLLNLFVIGDIIHSKCYVNKFFIYILL